MRYLRASWASCQLTGILSGYITNNRETAGTKYLAAFEAAITAGSASSSRSIRKRKGTVPWRAVHQRNAETVTVQSNVEILFARSCIHSFNFIRLRVPHKMNAQTKT